MGKRKTELLHNGYLDWAYAVTQGHILRCMRSFPKNGLFSGRIPPEIHRALHLLLLLAENPEISLDLSSASQNERLELAKLIFDYPEFMAAAIYTVFVAKPNTRAMNQTNERALVRKFLLTHATVVVPDIPGKCVSQVGATDNEINANHQFLKFYFLPFAANPPEQFCIPFGESRSKWLSLQGQKYEVNRTSLDESNDLLVCRLIL
jgi:hypothetical protein